jgi:hypothetical protein
MFCLSQNTQVCLFVNDRYHDKLVANASSMSNASAHFVNCKGIFCTKDAAVSIPLPGRKQECIVTRAVNQSM